MTARHLSVVAPLDPVAASKAAHPSTHPLDDSERTRAALMTLSREEWDSVLWSIARAQPGIVDAAIRRVRGGA